MSEKDFYFACVVMIRKILGIGNALVDVLVRIDNDNLLHTLDLPKGSMQLVSEERALKIVNATEGLSRHMSTGGSASNTISGLARLGLDVGFVGKVGKDAHGAFYENDLKLNGVSPHIIVDSTGISGCCNVLISQNSERTMATHLGVAASLEADELNEFLFADYDFMHIEGYLVQNYDLILRAARIAKKHNMGISLDLASYNIVSENLSFLRSFIDEYVDVVFANEDEAKALTGKLPEDALDEMVKMVSVAVVKIGEDGSWVGCNGERWHIPALKVKAVDTTGAGDIFASGFLFGYSEGLPLADCARIGTICASEVIQIVGAKLGDSEWERLFPLIESIKNSGNVTEKQQ